MTIAHLLDRHAHGRILFATQNAGRRIIGKNDFGSRDKLETIRGKLVLLAKLGYGFGRTHQNNL